jgi:hypothetical protein
MIRTTTRLELPSDEPPAQVTSEIVWRLAVRLFRDHGPSGPDDGPRRCGWCDQPWPCSGRRLAELGLNAAIV